jgi:hypothetical protein
MMLNLLVTLCILLRIKSSFGETKVCIVGYVMDIYCLNRGTLLDNPAIESLQNPDKHSVHCLVDVGQCRASGYQVLSDPLNTADRYCRAYTLDSTGNDLIVKNARAIGMCSTCANKQGQKAGYRATIIGTVANMNEKTPLLKVTSVQASSVGCSSQPGGKSIIPPKDSLECESGQDIPWQITHGTLMVTSWGLLLPSGVICARYLKFRKPSSIWFYYHRVLQITGIILALSGFIIAITKFNVSETDGKISIAFIHGICGFIVMLLGFLQPINAYFRPEHTHFGKEPTYWRKQWERLHKGSGYTAVTLAVITIFIGTRLPSEKSAQTAFLVSYILILVFLSGLIYMFRNENLISTAAANKVKKEEEEENLENLQ